MVPFHKRGKTETLELEVGDVLEVRDNEHMGSRRPTFPSPPTSMGPRSHPTTRPSMISMRPQLDSMDDEPTSIFSPDAIGPAPPPAPRSSGNVSGGDRAPRSAHALPPAPISNAFLSPSSSVNAFADRPIASRPTLFQPLSADEYTGLRPSPSTNDLGREMRPLIGRPPVSPMSTLSTAPIAFSSHAELATKVRPAVRRPKMIWLAGLAGGLAAGLLVALVADSESFLAGAANLVDSTAIPAAEARETVRPAALPLEVTTAKPFESALQAAGTAGAEPLTNFIEPRPPETVIPATLKVETKAAAPKVEAPKVETAKVEAPKVETAKVASPKVEAPRVTRAYTPPKTHLAPPVVARSAEPKKESNSSAAAKLADEQLKAALAN